MRGEVAAPLSREPTICSSPRWEVCFRAWTKLYTATCILVWTLTTDTARMKFILIYFSLPTNSQVWYSLLCDHEVPDILQFFSESWVLCSIFLSLISMDSLSSAFLVDSLIFLLSGAHCAVTSQVFNIKSSVPFIENSLRKWTNKNNPLQKAQAPQHYKLGLVAKPVIPSSQEARAGGLQAEGSTWATELSLG